jgi:putative Holliday junction resolvase
LLRPGRRLAVDVGKARIGLATTDVHAILASPLATVSRSADIQISIAEILSFVASEGSVIEIYVGLPTNLKGQLTQSTEDAVTFAEILTAASEIPVLLIDERFSTSVANAQLREIGKSQKSARSTIDQMAAVAILEYALNIESNSGKAPGLSASDWRASNE